ncbi:MAG: GGDEF domain-containing protein [Treponemataceae bacterium]|nr:GGDEF domain-containing protein [Treponemataceae bacterium]
MDLSEEIKGVIAEFFDKVGESVRYISCDSVMMKNIPGLLPPDCTIVDFYRPSVAYAPMAPFLEILHKDNPTEVLTEKYTYSLQLESFKSYFKTGQAAFRKDEILLDEVAYERKRCIRTVFELFSRSVSYPLVILNAQLMDKDSFEIVTLIEKVQRNKILVCFDFTEVDMTSESSAIFSDFRIKDNYYEVVRQNLHAQKDLAVVIEEKNFFSYENLKRCFSNCRSFLSLGFSTKLAKRFLQDMDEFSFTQIQFADILLEIAILMYYAGELGAMENALSAISNLENLSIEHKNLATYYSIPLLIQKEAYFDALNCCNHLIEDGQDKNEASPYTLVHMYKCLILHRTGDKKLEASYKKALLELQYDYPNNLVFCSSLISLSQFAGNVERTKGFLKIIEESLLIAEELGNDLSYSTVAHWKGILLSHLEDNEDSLDWLSRSDKMRRKLDDIQTIVNIRNDMAYQSILLGDYINAFKVMISVSDQILALSDSAEIINTLKTVAQVYLYIGYFAESHRLLNSISKILQVYNLDNLDFCTENDVHVMQALIDFYYGKMSHAQLSVFNVETNGLSYTDTSKALLLLLKALFALHDQDMEKADQCFKETKVFINENIPEQKHLMAYVSYMYAYNLNRFDHPELSAQVREEAFEYVKKENLEFYVKNYADIEIRRIYTLDFFLQQFLVSLERLEKQSIRNQVLNTLQKRIRDGLFLNRLMEESTNASGRSDYVKLVLKEISDYILCRGIFFAAINPDSNDWAIEEFIVRDATFVPRTEDWKYLAIKTGDSEENFISVDNNSWYYNLTRYESVAAIMIQLDDRKSYSDEDLNILKIGLSTFQSQLTIISQREHLQELSSIDQLSKLNNRRALEMQLETQGELIQRCIGKGLEYTKLAITFIDLDHFKFYNDTYGHEAGDVMIESFALLLKRVYRKVDFIARFGGDEFVVILPNCTSDEAYKATERLRAALAADNHFLPRLSQLLHINTDEVPEDKYLSFSAGICSNTEVDDVSNLCEVRGNADKALYVAKEQGRSRAILWTEIQ